MAYDIMSGFNVGQAIGGQSSLGEFVRQITQRAQMLQGLRLQAQVGLQSAVAQQQALMPGEVELKRREIELDPTKRFLEAVVGPMGSTGTSGLSGAVGPFGAPGSLQERLANIQAQLGPGQELTAGPFKVTSQQLTPVQQAQLGETTQRTRKTKQDIEKGVHPIQALFGTNVPGEGQNQTGLHIVKIEHE